ncbi:hypothetical protein Trco_003995 [Trichoderma cornu-damae]|uniref:HFB protein n=1 Tax=Trichoderma cornu-damae TaxID=654480 RepID=A0A9P8QS89_9HYPO|nr:hypothetical protein Trco_003995 [Trichoderma cornu-damae]
MARSLALLAVSSAALAAAQSTTVVPILLPYLDPQPLVASVVAADNTATTYAYGCKPGTPDDECGLAGTTQTVTQGPSTWVYSMSTPGDEDGTVIQGGNCKLNSAANVASCTLWFTQTELGSVSSTSVAHSGPYLDLQLPVTVTAGLDKLGAAPSGATSTGGSTPAATSSGASETAKTSASTGAATTTLAKQTTGTGTGIGTSTSTASTTAGPTSTNAAGILDAPKGLYAGVAAIVGGAMML